MSQHSEACCNIPPVISNGYSAKGNYIEVDGTKTYIVGDKDAKFGILFIYDIFGYFSQTIQGADILAYGNKERSYQVFMPDFLEGKSADVSWYPPDNEDKKKKLGEFFAGPAAGEKNVHRVSTLMNILKEKYSNITTWGIVGFCWGGKMVSLSCGEGTPFKAAAECHPAMIDPKDAENITIPIAILASKDEDAQAVNQFKENLKVQKHVETYSNQSHGWMAARANLDDPQNKSAYERGYKTLVKFFHEHL